MAGIDGFGVVLQREITPGGGSYEAIANVTSLSGPGLEREHLDVTDHDSPGQYEEIIFGIKRTGEIECDLNYDPSKHDKLLDDWNSSDPRGYKIIWPDPLNKVWELQAGLKTLEPESPHDDKLAASVTFKCSGSPNFNGTA